MKKLKNKKGFTLVEVIVVLVILAILAALLVPSLTGYIDKANNKALEAETRQAVMAAQTIASEYHGKTVVWGTNYADVIKLGEVTGTISSVTVADSKVTGLVYVNNGKTCTYAYSDTNGATFTVS